MLVTRFMQLKNITTKIENMKNIKSIFLIVVFAVSFLIGCEKQSIEQVSNPNNEEKIIRTTSQFWRK